MAGDAAGGATGGPAGGAGTGAADDPVVWGTARGRWVLLAAVLGSGVALLDATVVNVALPTLGRDLDADFAGLQWTVNGYTLTLAAFILLGGSLGDRFGRRKIFVVGTVWFGVASLLCAVAPTIGTLIAARALQGVGGALLTPGSLALLSASFAGADRGRAIGAWSGLGGVAGAIGPFVGGSLVEVSWRLVFLINLPLCALVVAVAVRHVPESNDPDMNPRLDLAGALLGALGLAGLTYALVEGGSSGVSSAVVASGAVAVLALTAFVVVELRSSHPMLPVDIFAERQFTAANAVTFAVYAALGGVFFLLVVHLQVVAAFSPLVAGTALLPVTVVMLALSARSGALAARIGPRLQMTVGPLLCAGAVLLLRGVGPSTSYLSDVLPAVTLFGLGLATVVAPLTVTVLAAAPSRHAGVASGINNAVARTAGLLAVAVLPVVAGLTGSDYEQPDAFAAGFRTAMLVSAGLLVVGAALAALTIGKVDVDAGTGSTADSAGRSGGDGEGEGGRDEDSAHGGRRGDEPEDLVASGAASNNGPMRRSAATTVRSTVRRFTRGPPAPGDGRLLDELRRQGRSGLQDEVGARRLHGRGRALGSTGGTCGGR